MEIFAKNEEREVTSAGALKEGFLAASIKNIGTKDALVNGVTLTKGEAKSYPFVGKGYKEILYDPMQSKLRIMEIS